MRLAIVAVGRARAGPEQDVYLHYLKRITFPVTLVEVAEKRALPPEQRMMAEAALLLGAAPAGAMIVALDERGRSLSSAEFARRLGSWRDDGVADVAFLIGGADGLHESVRKQAGLLLSLSAMTWPHMLVRGMLAEQVYRAQCILAGHPYHRD